MLDLKKTVFAFSFLFYPILLFAQACQTSNIPATTPTNRFTINSDETISDTKTRLMWKKCTEGTSGKDCSSGSPIAYTWQQALEQAKIVNTSGGFASYHDWRLPNIKELVSIAEKQCIDPGINQAVFPNTSAGGWFWSSSSSASHPYNAWSVNNSHGGSYEKDKASSDIYIRLVRG